MFRNLRITIFIYYFLTVSTFLILFYYLVEFQSSINFILIVIFFICFVVLSGIFISKLAIDPLQDYVVELELLSKETLHELNLPITTIISNTQMLEKSIDDKKSLRRLDRIKNSCEILKQRYNELDYMIKMQTKEELKEEFLLEEFLKDRIAFLEKLYPQISFFVEYDSLSVYVDKIGLSKVIDNLVDNAVKYSSNSDKIEIKIVKDTLSITDYGIGMDEFELLNIFDKYYQVNKNMQGFGIGLNMVKRYCDKNGIELNFNSKKGIGTIVKLKFRKVT